MPQHAPPRPLISAFGWEITSIIASSPNFHPVKRVHYTSPNAKVEIVIPEVERDGNPLIITGWNRHPRWPKSLFNIDWLKKNGDQNPTVRNVHNWVDLKITIDDFIKRLRETPAYASADEHERLYGKDGDCPAAWTEWLAHSGTIPDDLLFYGSNDFLKFLPDEAKVQTLMCYMGIGDTFTPFHKDLCASSGQNLMCFSEHSGSAFWFMTKSSAAPRVAAYFHQLGQEVDLETHVVTIEELAKAPFDVYIAEQQLGDLVLVPPRSCHQVVNKGGITIKTSWSRMSLHGLQTAFWHELPIYHRVCREEIYRVKSNIFHALQHFTRLTEDLPEHRENKSCPTATETLKQLVRLFDDILAAEASVSRDSMPHVSQSDISHTDNLRCDFCGADIFQSFFECDSCLPASSSRVSAGILPVGDGLVLCPLCYVEGRTCQCERMEPVQCRPFSDLLGIRDRAVRAIQRIDSDYIDAHGYLSEQPLRLLSGRDPNIFEAACKLFQKRQNDNKAARSCRRRESHLVPAPAAVYCKSCHFTNCYTHLLELDSVHSVDALMHSDRYDGDANWHQSHRNSSQQYQELRQRVIEDEERGSRPNASHRLVYLAKTFTTCRAIALEVTKHGWYDRFAQTTSIPIANSPVKALVGPPDELDGDEPHDSHASDDSPSNFVILPNGSEVQPSAQSSLSGTPQVLGSATGASIQSQPDISEYGPLSAPCSPSSARQPHIVASYPFAVVDDPGNLSDLTDLPTETDSPPRSSVTAIPFPESPEQQPPMELSVSLLLPPATSSNIQRATGSQLKPRLVFDCVEIPQPEWCSEKRENISSSRQKRKQITGPFLSDIARSPDSDKLLLAAQEISISSRSSKRKRKLSQGPASRLPRSSKRTHSSLIVRDRPSQSNFLANALNQTFQLNSTSATSRVPTTPLSSDAITPVSSSVINPNVKSRYRDIGVQKNPNFTRNTSLVPPSEDMSSCIIKLQAENGDLRAEVERCNRECEVYRENLDEITRLYNPSGSHASPPPASGPSNLNPNPRQEFSTHPRWRMRNIITDDRSRSMVVREPDHPPIETLPLLTPSSPESVSVYHRRGTPMEPHSFSMRTHTDVQGSQVEPYFWAQQHGRRRGPAGPMNGRRQRGKLRGPPSLGRSGNVTSNPAPPNSTALGEAAVSSALLITDTAIAQDHDTVNDKVPPSTPSTVSNHVQLPKSHVDP